MEDVSCIVPVLFSFFLSGFIFSGVDWRRRVYYNIGTAALLQNSFLIRRRQRLLEGMMG